MRLILMLLPLLCLTALDAIGQKTEAESGLNVKQSLSWGLEADFNTKYLWRGISFNDGLVIQPNVWATLGNFTGGLWGNFTVYDRFKESHNNELDLILTYNYTIGNFEIDHTVLLYYYMQQEDAPPTGEVFFGVGYPVGDFRLVSNITADFLSYRGSFFIEHGIEYEKELTSRSVVSSSVVLGWATQRFNETYIGNVPGSVNLIGLNLDWTYSPKGTVYFKPHVQLNRIISSSLFPFLGKYTWCGGLIVGFEK